MSNTIWLLTREVNEYGQEGEYFVAAFSEHPTKEQLYAAGVPNWDFGTGGYLEHVRRGGGRARNEDEWFNLTEYDPL